MFIRTARLPHIFLNFQSLEFGYDDLLWIVPTHSYMYFRPLIVFWLLHVTSFQPRAGLHPQDSHLM